MALNIRIVEWRTFLAIISYLMNSQPPQIPLLIASSSTPSLIRTPAIPYVRKLALVATEKAFLRHFLSNSLKSTKNKGGLQALYWMDYEGGNSLGLCAEMRRQ